MITNDYVHIYLQRLSNELTNAAIRGMTELCAFAGTDLAAVFAIVTIGTTCR